MFNDSVNLHKIFFFYPYNVKEWKATDDKPYLDLPNVLVDPDVSHLSKVKRQYWKIEDGKVVEKSPEEKEATDAWHKLHSITNPTVITVEKVIEKPVITEVVKEIAIEKKVVEFRTPLWCYIVITFLLTLIIYFLRGDL